MENAEFLPHYLTIERFGEDIQYFMDFRSLVDLTSQVREKLWNITIQSADVAYTDASPKISIHADFWSRSFACSKTSAKAMETAASMPRLRYAQTPRINVWSFAKGKTPKLSSIAG